MPLSLPDEAGGSSALFTKPETSPKQSCICLITLNLLQHLVIEYDIGDNPVINLHSSLALPLHANTLIQYLTN